MGRPRKLESEKVNIRQMVEDIKKECPTKEVKDEEGCATNKKCLDLISNSTAYITNMESVLISVSNEDIPEGATVLVVANSDNMLKNGVVPIFSVVNYQPEVKIRVYNFGVTPKRVMKGSVIATAVIL